MRVSRRIRRCVGFLLVIVSGLCGAVSVAEPSAEGFAAYRAGDYARARRSLQAAAARGDGRAMNLLGEMCATGKGAAQDYAQARTWFEAGAGKGDPDAANNLGELYAGGLGLRQDLAEAAKWFRKASAEGSAEGSYNLGRVLVMGPERSLAQGAAAFEKAVQARPGEARFHNWLGSVYLDLGRFTDAEGQFQAVAAAGKPADVWNWCRGEALLKLGRIGEARDAFALAVTEGLAHNRGEDRKADAASRLRSIEAYQERLREGIQALALRDYGRAAMAFEQALGLIGTDEARERLASAQSAAGERRLKIMIGWALGTLAVLFVLTGAMYLRRPRILEAALSDAELAEARLDGNFELKGVIGEGGMGRVYRAFDRKRNCDVAAKRLRTELRSIPQARDRFLKEARAVAKLRHPNIVGIQAVVEFKGETFIMLDFVAGETLSDVLARRQRLPFAECRSMMEQVCPAIEYAHRNGIVHRDLKPANIMAAADGRFLVTDFGLAREIKDTLSRVTNTEVAGTPVYMAPEQHLGKVCRQSDVYALGVILYEMLTGERPFPGPDLLTQKERLIFRRAGEITPEVPRGVDDLLARTFVPDPVQRPQSAVQFLDELQSCGGPS